MDEGAQVRMVGNPGQIGFLTGNWRPRGPRRAYQVQFPNGMQYVPEDQLELLEGGPSHPLELLRKGKFARAADLRRTLTHVRLTGRLADLIYSMETTNTDFYAYQFKPVLKMLSAPNQGLLIADEVGLGKTIEAGLIWTELRSRFDYRRLLVLCPAMLREKWRRELSHRFGVEADILDAGDTLDRLRQASRQGSYGSYAIIGSMQGLRPSRGSRASQELEEFLEEIAFDEPVIDFLIVDEAHYLKNPESKTSRLGRLLRRLGVTVNYGPLVTLGCAGYLAVTPNTLQFGARVDVMIGLSEVDIGIRGFMSFDALFYFSPFGFEARAGAGLSVSVAGVSLADLKVQFVLAGTTPWNIRGTATVKILFVDIPIDFDVSWGNDDAKRLAPIDPWHKLEQALARPESWGSELPADAHLVESLSEIKPVPEIAEDGTLEAQPLVLHPAGTLEIRQNVVPLDTTLSKFGNAPVQGHDRFRIDGITLRDGSADGVPLEIEPIDEQFARAQFEDLPDHKKLSLPSFEKMPGGVTTRSSPHVRTHGAFQSSPVTFESIRIGPNGENIEADEPVNAVSRWEESRFLLAGNAASRAAKRRGHDRFAAGQPGLVGTLAEAYVVVDTTTLLPRALDDRVDLPHGPLTRMQADQALAQHLEFHPHQAATLAVIPEWELPPVMGPIPLPYPGMPIPIGA